MLQVTLFQRIESLLSVPQNVETLMNVIDALEKEYSTLQIKLTTLLEGSQDATTRNNMLNDICNHVNRSVNTIKKDVGSRKLMREISNIEERMNYSLENEFHETEYLKSVLNKVNDFADTYDKYIRDSTLINAYQLLNIAHELKFILSQFSEVLHFILGNISSDYKCSEAEMEFSITLFYTENTKDFAEKILAINALYDELCFLLNVSQAQSPLRIGKIESGSLFTKLFGDTRVVGLLCSLVERAVEYFHRNHTTEGQIASIPKQIESFESMMNLIKKCEDIGVNVSESKENLAKGVTQLADNLNKLIKGQPSVEINGKQFSIGDKVSQQEFIKKNRDLRIPYDEKSPIETSISTAESVKIAPNPSN